MVIQLVAGRVEEIYDVVPHRTIVEADVRESWRGQHQLWDVGTDHRDLNRCRSRRSQRQLGLWLR